jgi:hypothetical protein
VKVTKAQGEALDEIFSAGYGYQDGSFSLSDLLAGDGLKTIGLRRVVPTLISRGVLERVRGTQAWTPERGNEDVYKVSAAGRSAYNDWRESHGEAPWGCPS